MTPRLRPLALALAVLLGTSAASGQGVTLQYRWAKGDDLRYRLTQQTATTMTGLPGMDTMALGQTFVQVMRLTVEDVAAGGAATIRETFESMRMDMTSPMGKMAYDSAAEKPTDPMSAMIASILGPMIGESITIVVTPTGGVQKVEGMSRIREKIVTSVPQDPTGAAMAEQFKAMFTDEAMGSMMKQGFLQFPDHVVQPGDTWNGQFNITMPTVGSLTTTIAATFKSVEGAVGSAIAHIATALTMKQETAAVSPMGFSLKMGDAKGEGETLFDVAKGRVQKLTLKTDMPASMSMSAPDGSQLNPQMAIKTTMTMELVEK